MRADPEVYVLVVLMCDVKLIRVGEAIRIPVFCNKYRFHEVTLANGSAPEFHVFTCNPMSPLHRRIHTQLVIQRIGINKELR